VKTNQCVKLKYRKENRGSTLILTHVNASDGLVFVIIYG